MRQNKIALLALPLAALLVTGCIQRTMRIQTEPAGAKLWVNSDEIGTTPAEIPFENYGTIEVFLQKENYKTMREEVTLSPPWYAYFPLDFFTDVLYPGTLNDRKVITLKMEPLGKADLEGVKARAEEFREKAENALAQEEKAEGIAPKDQQAN